MRLIWDAENLSPGDSVAGTNSTGAERQWRGAGSVAQSTGRIQVLIQLHWDLMDISHLPSHL